MNAPRPPARRSPAARFRALYGESPAHLLILLASFAVCGYAAAKLLARDWSGVAKWVVGAALVHDLVLLPLYAVADWLLHKALGVPRAPGGASTADGTRTPDAAPTTGGAGTPDEARTPAPHRPDLRAAAVQHFRVPALLSLLLLLVYWPLISGPPARFEPATALSPGVFAGRWWLITAVLFGASGLLFALRWWRARRPPVRSPHQRTVRSARRSG